MTYNIDSHDAGFSIRKNKGKHKVRLTRLYKNLKRNLILNEMFKFLTLIGVVLTISSAFPLSANAKEVYYSGDFYYDMQDVRYVSKGSEPFSGTYVKHWPSGVMSLKMAFKNGLRHGEYKSWYENGVVQSIWFYSEDKFDGVSQSWYENGSIRYETNYLMGEKHGVSRNWGESGELFSESTYEGGELKITLIPDGKGGLMEDKSDPIPFSL